jgi:hypothetical protein
LTHLVNVLAGATLLETVSQVAYAVAFGVAFAALVLREGIIWSALALSTPSHHGTRWAPHHRRREVPDRSAACCAPTVTQVPLMEAT